MGKKLKNAQVVVEDDFGVCVWRMPDGAYLGDGEGRFLSLQGKLHDPIIEIKMSKAAQYYLGEEAKLGGPLWLPGSRQVTDNEADDQMERLLNGRIPDVADQASQLEKKNK